MLATKSRVKSWKKRSALPRHFHVKKGDLVMIIAGRDKGQTGVIKRVLRHKGAVLVEGLNLVKKAVRPNPMSGNLGGIIAMEAPLNVSKVMLYDTRHNQAGRARVSIQDGQRTRLSKKTGEAFDI